MKNEKGNMTTFLIAAITADGFIARHSRHLADWTSKEDKQFFTQKTKEAGVVDKLYLTVEPVLFGAGIGLFTKELDVRLTLQSVQKLNEQSTLFEYNIMK